MSESIRYATVAGSWYPREKSALSSMIDDFLNNVDYNKNIALKALISPHAGYMFSGQVAAYGYRQVSGNFNRVIVLAPCHHYYLDGASIVDKEYYRTPLGDVRISPIAKQLIEKSGIISSIPDAHATEHSIEMQLPFLQKVLDDFEIIPILTGRMTSENRVELSELINKNLDEKTLLVASSDLSHFHPYDDAVSLDSSLIRAIESLDERAAQTGEMCGSDGVLITMDITGKRGWSSELLKYQNSGDVRGDKSSVVGYASFAFY